MKWFNKWRAGFLIRHSRYRVQLSGLPVGLETYWRETGPQEHKGIRTDAFFFACSAEGLMNFFDAVRRNGVTCALPSEAVRSVWQAWQRHDPLGLETLCFAHFGRTVPSAAATDPDTGKILNTLAACRAIAGPGRDHFPELFSLDARFHVPHGQGYWLAYAGILHAQLDGAGNGFDRACPHPELTPEALRAAGLRKWYAPELRSRRQRATSSASYRGASLVFSFGTAHARDVGTSDVVDEEADDWNEDDISTDADEDSEDFDNNDEDECGEDEYDEDDACEDDR
jgi:hypothetical protein